MLINCNRIEWQRNIILFIYSNMKILKTKTKCNLSLYLNNDVLCNQQLGDMNY